MICEDTYPVFNNKINAPFGGAQTMAYMLAKGFAQITDCESSVLVYDYGQDKTEKREGVYLHRSPSKRLTAYLSKPTLLKRKVEDRINALLMRVSISEYYKRAKLEIFTDINPDIYLLFGVSDANYKTACELNLLGFNWAILLVHDEDVSQAYKLGTNFKNRHGQPGEECFKLIEMTSSFVAQNEFQLNELRTVFGKTGTMIKTPIEIAENNISEKTTILWVARATDVKRPELFLELARLLPQEQCVMVTNDNDRARYESLLEAAPQNLTIHKNIPFNKIDQFFSKAKLFVNTSISEGFPVTFLHAGKYAVPVFTLGVDPNELFSIKQCGKVFNNVDSMIQYLNMKLLNELGNNLRAEVEQFHDSKEISRQILEYINGNYLTFLHHE